MNLTVDTPIEKSFLALPSTERVTIIRHGVALRLSDLRKRLFLAESKLQSFEAKYNTSLAKLDSEGLPDEAGVEMHEDYIMWHHWTEAAQKARSELSSLEDIERQGLWVMEARHAG
jgi:hypothetical protein